MYWILYEYTCTHTSVDSHRIWLQHKNNVCVIFTAACVKRLLDWHICLAVSLFTESFLKCLVLTLITSRFCWLLFVFVTVFQPANYLPHMSASFLCHCSVIISHFRPITRTRSGEALGLLNITNMILVWCTWRDWWWLGLIRSPVAEGIKYCCIKKKIHICSNTGLMPKGNSLYG